MTAPDPRVGTVLHGRYRVLERTNAGSMGVIYRAERVGLGRSVAIKILHESYAATADGMRRFEVEARAMSRLSHPNCVSVLDYGVDGGSPYLVMDYIAGRNLRDILQAKGRLPPRRVVALARQLVAGLAHAHAHSILHRDVKPENILVTPAEGKDEQVHIVDFGLAKLRDEKSLTTGVALGTPGYMSPEQTVGERADERSDVYAVGMVLYELLAGDKPFHSGSMWELMRMQRETPPKPLSQAVPEAGVSARLEAVVLRALAKGRDDRFASMTEMLHALEATREAAGPRAQSRRSAMITAAGVGAALLVAIVLSVRARPGGLFEAASGSPAATESGSDAPKPGAGAEITVAPVEALRQLAAEGELSLAIESLEALRKDDPKRANVHYALGNLCADARRWRRSVAAYARAIELEPRYARDDRTIADVVLALASDRAKRAATRLIERSLGEAAIGALETASRSSNRKLRSRARRLLERLTR